MNANWTRRDVLKTIAATVATPVLAHAAPPRRTVAIIGAGMAGISVAWLLDGQRDVVLLESRDSIGGNVRSLDVDLDGHQFAVDLGAQFFHPGPYPVYTALLESLDLFPPDVAAPPPSAAFPASITIEKPGEATPRFVSPIIPTRLWPISEAWNLPGLQAFLTAFNAAKAREQNDESWLLTLGDWLPTLGLSQEQWEGIILPWAASLFSGDIEQARGMSARAAMLFAAKALPENLTEQVVDHVLRNGLIEPMRRMLDQCSTVEVITNAAVSSVSRGGGRRFTVHCADGQSFAVDDVVFAASGPGTLQLLEGVPDRTPSSLRWRHRISPRQSRAAHRPDLRARGFDELVVPELPAARCKLLRNLDVARGRRDRRPAGDSGKALEKLDDTPAATADAGAASGRFHAHAADAGVDSGADGHAPAPGQDRSLVRRRLPVPLRRPGDRAAVGDRGGERSEPRQHAARRRAAGIGVRERYFQRFLVPVPVPGSRWATNSVRVAESAPSHQFFELKGVPDRMHDRVFQHRVDAVPCLPARGILGRLQSIVADALQRRPPSPQDMFHVAFGIRESAAGSGVTRISGSGSSNTSHIHVM